jgi:hypothetical protein
MAFDFRKIAPGVHKRAQRHVAANSRKTIKIGYFHFDKPYNSAVGVLKKAQ